MAVMKYCRSNSAFLSSMFHLITFVLYDAIYILSFYIIYYYIILDEANTLSPEQNDRH